MTESKQLELMNFVADTTKKALDGESYIIEDMARFTERLHEYLVQNTRCTNDMHNFIDFMNQPVNRDLRFWQGVRAFTKSPFVLVAKELDLDNGGVFKGIRDTYYDEKAI